MAKNYLGRAEAAVTAVPATSVATAVPDANTTLLNSGEGATVTTYVSYSGTVSSGTLRLWLYEDGTWYKGAELALDSSGGNTVFDWDAGRGRDLAFQVEAINGGGSVTVKVRGA